MMKTPPLPPYQASLSPVHLHNTSVPCFTLLWYFSHSLWSGHANGSPRACVGISHHSSGLWDLFTVQYHPELKGHRCQPHCLMLYFTFFLSTGTGCGFDHKNSNNLLNFIVFNLLCMRSYPKITVQGFRSPAYLSNRSGSTGGPAVWKPRYAAGKVHPGDLSCQFSSLIQLCTNSLYNVNKILSSLEILKLGNLSISRRKKEPSVCP